jgi:hypothetical protein
LHFKRPSSLWPGPVPNNLDGQDWVTPLAGYHNLLIISHALYNYPRPSIEHLEQLIPLELRISRGAPSIDHSSAMLYIALHPIFTDQMSGLFSGQHVDRGAADLLKVIAQSASAVIDSFVLLQRENRILSVWRSAERVLEAGAVWAAYLLFLKRSQLTNSIIPYSSTITSLLPLWKCSNLLGSFAERWKEGAMCSQVWEIFLTLLLGVLEYT